MEAMKANTSHPQNDPFLSAPTAARVTTGIVTALEGGERRSGQRDRLCDARDPVARCAAHSRAAGASASVATKTSVARHVPERYEICFSRNE